MFSMKEEPERHTCIDINNGRIGNNVNGTSTDVISPYAEYRSRSPKKKLGISVIYYMICMWIASFCSVLANDWVPDKKFHPSLPDIVFDNTPILPHGNTVTDWLIMCIVVLSLAVVLSNKNRLIIFRHFFCSICTMYLMRSVTILVTPLPVPASNLPCWPQTDGSLQSILKATLTHYTSASITVKKGILCGDLMYSGHACMFIFLAFNVHKYASSYKVIQVLGWTLAILGTISVIASRIHYTVDVVVSICLCSFAITLHEILLDNPALMEKHRITRILFPLLHYMEAS